YSQLYYSVIKWLIVIHITMSRAYLVYDDTNPAEKKSFSVKLDRLLRSLGVIGFCSMATEGAMFDWSGVYFHDIVKVPEKWTTLGYASFMIMMALGRFMGDAVISRIGRKRTLQISGLLMFIGMMGAVIFP